MIAISYSYAFVCVCVCATSKGLCLSFIFFDVYYLVGRAPISTSQVSMWPEPFFRQGKKL